MKMDKVAGSGDDEFYTPLYAVKPIFKYLKEPIEYSGENDMRQRVIWCPFDTADSLFVKYGRELGYKVIHSHIDEGRDFFKTNPKYKVDYIVSNPPYSCKAAVLEELFKRGIPFAMLVGVVGLFESQHRFEMFRDNNFEIMYLNKRVSYFQDYNDPKPKLNPPFSSVYVCSGVLPKQICFEEIDKKDLTL